MQIKGVKYEFSSEPWRYNAPGGWHFVSLPSKVSAEIRTALGSEEEGWGRLKATAKVGQTEWKTAIWFDRKRNTYLLPLKAAVRKNENLMEGKKVKVLIWV